MYILCSKQFEKFNDFISVSSKPLKTLKYLPKSFFSMDIMELYLLSYFCNISESRLESVIKVALFIKNQSSKPWNFKAYVYVVNIWWNNIVQIGIQTIQKENAYLLSKSLFLDILFSIIIERSKNDASQVNI